MGQINWLAVLNMAGGIAMALVCAVICFGSMAWGVDKRRD